MLLVMGVADGLARLLEPWSSLYRNSPAVRTTLTFLHLAGIFLGGGFAIATDRETFIAVAARLSGQIRHLQHLHTIHRPVILGLVIAISSGFLLFLADIETFARSWVFWVKMTLLALLLANGYLLSRTENALRQSEQPDSPLLWARVRYHNAVYAFLLWCPHQRTALRWYDDMQRFECPKHHSKYQPAGIFIEGRATRGMDRYALHKSGDTIVVDLAMVYQQDKDLAGWEAAVVKL